MKIAGSMFVLLIRRIQALLRRIIMIQMCVKEFSNFHQLIRINLLPSTYFKLSIYFKLITFAVNRRINAVENYIMPKMVQKLGFL